MIVDIVETIDIIKRKTYIINEQFILVVSVRLVLMIMLTKQKVVTDVDFGITGNER